MIRTHYNGIVSFSIFKLGLIYLPADFRRYLRDADHAEPRLLHHLLAEDVQDDSLERGQSAFLQMAERECLRASC